jgi:AcrR family transcriptional regulator|tara:strand:- start:211 stop:774 length:564 start_codon:yes stop_codon:yes gene_type:complete
MDQISIMEKQDARITKTRQKVLDAGAIVLFTDGWSEVTHLRLAKETGVARGTIYRHWPTIDDLIVEIFESCDPAPYAAERIGELRADLIAELKLLSENLASSKLGDVILNAARLADKNAKMARVHSAMHDIIRQPFLAILTDHGLKPDREAVGHTLVAPILYHHLFEAGQKQINVEPFVDRFLSGPD